MRTFLFIAAIFLTLVHINSACAEKLAYLNSDTHIYCSQGRCEVWNLSKNNPAPEINVYSSMRKRPGSRKEIGGDAISQKTDLVTTAVLEELLSELDSEKKDR